MIETERKMDSKEKKKSGLQTVIMPIAQVSPELLQALIEFYKIGYADPGVSEEHFKNVAMANTSEVLQILDGDKIAAACNINVNRVTRISVNPDYRGQRLGVKLFQEMAKHNPKAWITIGAEAEAMLATISDDRLNYLPIENKDEVEALYKGINGVGDDFRVEIVTVEVPLLSKRLKSKGIVKKKFTAFYRPGSLHGGTYKQILFQNQG